MQFPHQYTNSYTKTNTHSTQLVTPKHTHNYSSTNNDNQYMMTIPATTQNPNNNNNNHAHHAGRRRESTKVQIMTTDSVDIKSMNICVIN